MIAPGARAGVTQGIASRSGLSRVALLPAGVLLLGVWTALILWQVAEHTADVRRHEAALRRAGDAAVDMLEAALRSMGRGRRDRPDALGGVLSELTSVPHVRGAWLTEPDGTVIASAGRPQPIPPPTAFAGAVLSETGLLVGRRADIGPCPYDGRGRRRGAASADAPTYLFLSVDREEMDREIAQDLGMRAILLAAATLAIIAALFLVRSRERTRRLRTELAVSEERSRRNQEWATLGAGLAHETKNPLALVRGLAQRLAEAEGVGQRAGPCRQIVDEVDCVVARINEFLQFSRPVEPRWESIDLRGLLEEMAGLVAPDLAPRRGRLAVDCGAIMVQADRDMMRQVLLNLLVNAARAIGPEGAIRLGAREGADGRVLVEVADDGPGIAPEDLARVFEPYFTRTPGGIGLGLAIVRRRCEAHGWQVAIESEPGRGTTVRITGLERASGGP